MADVRRFLFFGSPLFLLIGVRRHASLWRSTTSDLCDHCESLLKQKRDTRNRRLRILLLRLLPRFDHPWFSADSRLRGYAAFL